MDDHKHDTLGNGTRSFTPRDLLMVGFRQRRLVVLSFSAIFLSTLLFVLLRPAQYEAQMKILLKHERVEPVVTSEESAQRQLLPEATEAELNSEVELLRSRDLLTEVVAATGLHQREAGIWPHLWTVAANATEERPSESDKTIARATRVLEDELEVLPISRSSLILVSYASSDAALSAAVLGALADRYLAKHLAVRRPPGAFRFFDQEVERYRTQLAALHARLDQHRRDTSVVSAQLEKETALRHIGELEATAHATRVQIAETTRRITALRAQELSTPARATTEIRTASGAMIQELRSTLMTLELKRIELIRVFQPTYPPVQEVETQIAKVKESIAAVEQSPPREETTNRNPTHDYVVTELGRNRAELAALQARAAAGAQSLDAYRSKAQRLAQIELVEQDLAREAKQVEENYLTSYRKREEARLSDALDAQGIVNVAIAEKAAIPVDPTGPPASLLVLLGALVAGLVSVAVACAVDFWNPSFRTPDEVESTLGTPVLAALPRSGA